MFDSYIKLTIPCLVSNGLFFSIKQIRHCNILDLPADIFSGFENLDSFIFEGGTIDTIDVNAFVGLSVEKLSSDDHVIPRNLGKFEFQYTKFSGSEIPAGILYNMKNLTTIVFRVRLRPDFITFITRVS